MEEKKYICIENEQTFTESELHDLYLAFIRDCGESDEWTYYLWKLEAMGKNGTIETIADYNRRMKEIEW